MLADDVVDLVDVVGRVDRDWQIAIARCLGRLAHERDRARLDFAGHQDSANAISMIALVALDEVKRQIKFSFARGLVYDAHELAAVTSDPAAAVKARAEITSVAEFADSLEKRLLNTQLASEFHERRDAVAQELCGGEARIQAQLFGHRTIVGTRVTWVAADACALACHADFQEGLAEIVATSNIGYQPVRCAVAGMHMRINKSRRDELVACIDLMVDAAVETSTDEQNCIAFIDELSIAPKGMMAVRVPNQPTAGNASTH